MLSDKIFRITLAISAAVHGAILFQNLNLNLNLTQLNKKQEKIEVRYLSSYKESPKSQQERFTNHELGVKIAGKITVDKKPPPPFINRDAIFKSAREYQPSEIKFTKPTLNKTEVISVKRKITLPPVDLNKINNSSYISYYQIVREKIRRAAYQNFTHTETGQTCLSFVVTNEGELKDIVLVEDKSSNSQYLKDISMRSIKSASPFPKFPKELDYPRLSFNVIISFEVE